MADDKTGNAANAGTDENSNAANQNDLQTKNKSGWTQQEFEDALQREADRRVSQAQDKWASTVKEALGTNDLNAVKTQLEKLQAEASTAKNRAAFAETAHTQGIADIKAAWAVAKEYALIDDKGRVDFEKMKTEHPSLFGNNGKPTNPGGRTPDTGGKKNMNMTDILRNAVRNGG